MFDPAEVARALSHPAKLRSSKLIDAELSLDERMLSFVATGELPPLVEENARLELVPDRPLPREAHERAKVGVGRDVVLLRGAAGSGRKSTALSIARAEKRPLLRLTVHARSIPVFDLADRDARMLG